jgi:hypothetical protein
MDLAQSERWLEDLPQQTRRKRLQRTIFPSEKIEKVDDQQKTWILLAGGRVGE